MTNGAGRAGKAALRARLAADRTRVADDVRAAEATALTRHLERIGIGSATVCAYAPVGSEPGSVGMLDALLRHAHRVLLPVARLSTENTAVALQWGEYRPGSLVPARWGLLEPPAPWLPATALAEADVVLLPALAVDRHGVRLGRGRGFYDRSLPLRATRTRLVAVVRDAELVDELPSEPHDVPMTHVLTPALGLASLPIRE
ncbi:5-formyltetrahydrofolate cyclo-ligase [Mycobacterium sp.]|uniref:5-formyltetrahydrofolate cyclo-ligase n=1 Tax=Mycobacterium sp. TaxID=1785 RepID=UPI003A8B67BF